MDDLIFVNADEFSSTLRCTIQRTGKLGFTEFTQKKLKLNIETYVKIAYKGTKGENLELFLLFCLERTEGAFKLSKAGGYFYVNTKALFDSLDIDYKAKPVIYDMKSLEKPNLYKLIKRGKEKVIKEELENKNIYKDDATN